MGYIYNSQDAQNYEQWLNTPGNKHTFEVETTLMLEMLDPRRRESILDIGCGTGNRIQMLLNAGLDVTGLEPSGSLLEMAKEKFGHRVDFYFGKAENLPFGDNSFNYVCMLNTLEFVDNAEKAIEEACRVAKDRVFIGVINRHSIFGTGIRCRRLFQKTSFDHAHLFSIWELKRLVRILSGDVPIFWRTQSRLSKDSGTFCHWLQCSKIARRFPFGSFVGMVVVLVPRFRTRPLELMYPCAENALAS